MAGQSKYENIYVHINFISGTTEKSPTICIESPIDMHEKIGVVHSLDGFVKQLQEFLACKDDTGDTNGFFFHTSSEYNYTFSLMGYSAGCLFGMRAKRDKVDGNGVVKKAKLMLIRTQEDFDLCVKKSGVFVPLTKSKSGRKVAKTGRIDHIDLELAVVLRRTKVKKTKVSAAPKGKRSASSVSLLTSTSSSKRKKKERNDPNKVKVRTLDIEIYAPLEKHEKKNESYLAPIRGSDVKFNVKYSLEQFIDTPNKNKKKQTNTIDDDDERSTGTNSSLVDDSETNKEDDDIVKVVEEKEVFHPTISLFRRDMMALCKDEFPDEYSPGEKKKKIGKLSRLYTKIKYNSATWNPIITTRDLVSAFNTMTQSTSRVNGDVLAVRIAFGRAQGGNEFKTQEELETYLDDDAFRYGMLGYNSEEPKTKHSSSTVRMNILDTTEQANDIVQELYEDVNSPLYQAFTYEHGRSFFQIILAEMSKNKDKSFFSTTFKEGRNLNDDEVKKYILNPFKQRMNDKPDFKWIKMKKRDFPPDEGFNVPPNINHWKRTAAGKKQKAEYLGTRAVDEDDVSVTTPRNISPQQYQVYNPHQNNIIMSPPTTPQQHQVNNPHHQNNNIMSPPTTQQQIKKKDPVKHISFIRKTEQYTYKETANIPDITDDLTIESVLNSEGIITDAGVPKKLPPFDTTSVDVRIYRKDGTYMQQMYTTFKKEHVHVFFRLENLHENCEVEFIDRPKFPNSKSPDNSSGMS